MWVALWTARVRLWQNPLPHVSHLKGFSLECMYLKETDESRFMLYWWDRHTMNFTFYWWDFTGEAGIQLPSHFTGETGKANSFWYYLWESADVVDKVSAWRFISETGDTTGWRFGQWERVLPVVAEMVLSPERLAADLAWKGPLVRVGSLVDQQVVGLGEVTPAVLAYELFLSSGKKSNTCVILIPIYIQTSFHLSIHIADTLHVYTWLMDGFPRGYNERSLF